MVRTREEILQRIAAIGRPSMTMAELFKVARSAKVDTRATRDEQTAARLRAIQAADPGRAWDATHPLNRAEIDALYRQLEQLDNDDAAAAALARASKKAIRNGAGARSLRVAVTGDPANPAFTAARQWWTADPPKWNLLLHGNPGGGKTAAAHWALLEATKRGMSAEVRKAASIVRISQFDGVKELEHLKRAGLLVIDDLGAEKLSGYGASLLGELLDARYEAEAPTIITANLTLAQLSEHLGQRIVDRLAQGGMRVEVLGKSLRRGHA